MALRSMSPRITGALAGLAMLSACGSHLTSPSQPPAGFRTQQCAAGYGPTVATNLVPFSYWGLGYGSLGAGFGGLGVGGWAGLGLGVLGGPWDLFGPGLVPYKAGAIGSALPFDPYGYGAFGLGSWGYGGIGPVGYGVGMAGFGGGMIPGQATLGRGFAQPITQGNHQGAEPATNGQPSQG